MWCVQKTWHHFFSLSVFFFFIKVSSANRWTIADLSANWNSPSSLLIISHLTSQKRLVVTASCTLDFWDGSGSKAVTQTDFPDFLQLLFREAFGPIPRICTYLLPLSLPVAVGSSPCPPSCMCPSPSEYILHPEGCHVECVWRIYLPRRRRRRLLLLINVWKCTLACLMI